MKSSNFYFTGIESLTAHMQTHNIIDSNSVLIQIFTSENDLDYIQKILDIFNQVLPQSNIIGSTTDGEIMEGKVSTKKTVIVLSQFSETRLKVAYVEHESDSFLSGKYLASELLEEDSKLLISFADGLHTNGEDFLNGIDTFYKNVIIAGGLAGDNHKFSQSYVFTKDKILGKGAVAVSLSGHRLQVKNGYSFNWRTIGKKLKITKVISNRVYEIGNRTAYETYQYYLGKDIAKKLPGVDFPLIMIRDSMKIARVVLRTHKDGSLSFSGNFKVGDEVQFGYGNAIEILEKTNTLLDNIKNYPSESIFVYSCVARRRYMPETIENEILPLNDIAPTSGFFTYGEFYSGKYKKDLLNQTMTVISLSETSLKNKKIEIQKIDKVDTRSINALIHLVNTTAKEAIEQDSLKKVKMTFETLFKKSPDGILIIKNRNLIQCNQKMMHMFNYKTEDEMILSNVFKLFPKRQTDGLSTFLKLRKMQRWSEEENSVQFECQLKKSTGEIFWADVIFTDIVLMGEKVLYIVCRDISGKKKMETMLTEQKNILYRQANYDALTGLANRTLFMSVLKHQISYFEEHQNFALMFVDLDHFKQINDSLGHAVGDDVIRVIAERLENCIDKGDLVARLGGDEFLILTSEITRDEVIVKANKVLKALVQPVIQDNYTFYTSASIGICMYPFNATSAEKLLTYADTAMYKAKELGGNRYQFYKSTMTDSAYDTLVMERDLHKSIKHGEFEIYYQPQIDVVSGEILGMEALVRWMHPTKGMISPNEFIPLVEKTGLIVVVDLWVMKTAIMHMSKWHKEGLQPLTLSVNMSMKTLEEPKILEKLQSFIKIENFDAHYLEIELTETVLMKNPQESIEILNKFHKMGIRIAIDDFGTGYSSLAYLKYLPIDKLKIDKSFIDDIPYNNDAVMIIKTIISLAKNLQLDVIAEGVETQEQKDFLYSLGCFKVQGYLYSKPLSVSQMEAFIKVNRKAKDLLLV